MLKYAKRLIPLNIYPHYTLHNNLRYIAQSYTLLYKLINAIKAENCIFVRMILL